MFHTPVLIQETIEWLNLNPNDNVIDATLGGGGHAEAMLKATSPNGQVIGFDLDPAAVRETEKRLKGFGQRIHLFQKSYTNIKKIYDEQFPDIPIDAILLDLGLSSFQLKDRTRGFSFLDSSAPLDMRFSGEGKTAADVLNTFSKKDLTHILSEYGQEPYTRQIVTDIYRQRQKQKFSTVGDLTAAVLRVYKNKLHSNNKEPWVGGTHPATRTFQALRMAVNDELANIQTVLRQAVDVMVSGGRLAVISFHSLEDKVVKEFISRESRDCVCPPELPVCRCQHKKKIKRITKKAIKASADELKKNSRARSAHLRVVQKI